MIYLELILSFLQVGLFSFGGGYAALALIQSELVFNHAWVSMSQFNDMVAISQMTPGPFAINIATFIGVQEGGIIGGIIATYAIVIPSFFICSILAYLYYKYRDLTFIKKVLRVLRGSVVGLIAVGGGKILEGAIFSEIGINYYAIILLLVAFYTLQKYKINAILLMVITGFIYFLTSVIFS